MEEKIEFLREIWQQRRYFDALLHAWQLPSFYDYRAISRPEEGLTLYALAMRACQEAVAHVEREEAERRLLLQRLEDCLRTPAPAALVDHDDGEDREDAEQQRTHMLHACLACAHAALAGRWTAATVSIAQLRQIAKETQLAVGLLHDLILTFLTQPYQEEFEPRAPLKSVTTVVLLVEETQKKEGVTATLTLELVEQGDDTPPTIYPAREFAFVYRDQEFRDTEDQACAMAASMLSSSQRLDIRWRLKRSDRKPKPILALSGPSLGLAFTVGIAKLLAPA